MRKLVNGQYVDLTAEEIAEYEASLPPEPTAEELQAEYLKECETAVDAHILAQVTSLGYDTIDSIAKYLRPTSPFYDEAVALGDWIDACWVKCHELLNAGVVIAVDELITQLPEFTYGL